MELVRLRLSDLERCSGVLTIREGKSRRDRVVPIGERALHWLDKYLAVARSHFVIVHDSGGMRNRKRAEYALVDADKLDREANAPGEYQIDAEDERVVPPVSSPAEKLTTTPS